jgi:hypothetical protein
MGKNPSKTIKKDTVLLADYYAGKVKRELSVKDWNGLTQQLKARNQKREQASYEKAKAKKQSNGLPSYKSVYKQKPTVQADATMTVRPIKKAGY